MARMLAMAGATLPNALINSALDNTEELYESRDIATFNDEVLRAFDSRWDDPFGPRRRRNKSLPVSQFVPTARELLKSEFNGSDLIVLKEPRVSLLLELWQQAFALEGFADCYVILVARPMETHLELRGDKIEHSKAMLLWSTYMTNAEARTRAKDRIFITFDDLLDQTAEVLDRIEEAFSINFPRRSWSADARAQHLLQVEASGHDRAGSLRLSPALAPVEDLYNFFCAAAQGAPRNDDVPGKVASWLDGLAEAVGPLLASAELDLTQSRVEAAAQQSLREELDRSREETQALQAELAELAAASQAQTALLEQTSREQLAQAVGAAQTAAERVAELSVEIATAKADAAQVEQVLRNELVQTEAAAQASAQRVVELEAELQGARSTAAEREQALRSLLTQAEEAAGAAAQRIADLEVEIEGASRKASELEQALHDQRTQADEGAQAAAERIAHLEAEVEDARGVAAELKQALRGQHTQADEAVGAGAQRIADLGADIVAAQYAAAEIEQRLSAQLTMAASEVETATRKVTSLESELAILLAQTADFEQTLAAERADAASREWTLREQLSQAHVWSTAAAAREGAFLERISEAEATQRAEAAAMEQQEALRQQLAAARTAARAALDEASRLQAETQVLQSRLASAEAQAQTDRLRAEAEIAASRFEAVFNSEALERAKLELSGLRAQMAERQTAPRELVAPQREPGRVRTGSTVLQSALSGSDISVAAVQPLDPGPEDLGAAASFDAIEVARLSAIGAEAERFRIDDAAKGIDDAAKERKAVLALFDASWYLDTYPDVASSGIDPAHHYLEHGWREGRKPTPGFDPGWYLKTYSDVAQTGKEPFAHYILHGAREGRVPIPELAPIDESRVPSPLAAEDDRPTVELAPDGLPPRWGDPVAYS